MWMLVVALLLPALLGLYYNFVQKRRGLPPGPTPLPLLGNMLQLAARPPGVEVFREWRRRYGPVFTYWMGEKPMVALADFAAIRDAFVRDADNWTGRDFFDDFFTGLSSCTVPGLTGAEGELWREHRAFLMRALNGLGLSKSQSEQKILAEIEYMFANIDQDLQSGVVAHDISAHLDLVMGGMANIFLFGHSFAGDRKSSFRQLRQRINNYMTATYGPASLIVMGRPEPWRRVPYFSSVHRRIEAQVEAMSEYVDRQIADHVKRAQAADAEEDYVTLFLREMEKRGGADGYNLPQLRANLLDLWIAAQETTSSTLSWAMVFSVLNPDKQRLLQAELDRVVGHDRLVTLADRPHLPYTLAYCNEVQRLANVLPQSIPRRNWRRTEVHGFTLEPGTSCMGLMSVVLSDPSVFPQPDQFTPERFLDAQGQLKHVPELIPFSAGRRVCVGAQLARTEIFLVLANAFNRYSFGAAMGEPLPSLKRGFGFSVSPQAFSVSVSLRA